MANHTTYSLQILLGTIAAFAVAAGAFAAPESLISGLLALILATCGPGLLVVVWRSGGGYRRSFVIGAAAPSLSCAYRILQALVQTQFIPAAGSGYAMPIPGLAELVVFTGLANRSLILVFMAISLGGGLAGVGVHWLMATHEADAAAQNNHAP